MTDLLAEKRQEITSRLAELKPQVDEYRRLEAAVAALAGVPGVGPTTGGPTDARRGGPGRSRGSKATATSAAPTAPVATPARRMPAGRRRLGRAKGSGRRAAEAMAFINEQPGITIPELAVKMGIKQNYLYAVVPGLKQEGKAKKQGRGWHPTTVAV